MKTLGAYNQDSRSVRAIALPSTSISTLDPSPWTVWTTMDTRNAVVRKIRGLIYILESGEAQEVQIPLISILLQITDFESDGNGALQSE
jgi:hypothetical protein